MTPLDYFGSFIWVHKQDGEPQEFEDTRTGDTFETRDEVNEHCKKQANEFESEADTEL